MGAIMYPKDTIKLLSTLIPQGMTNEQAIAEVKAIYEAREHFTLKKKDALFKMPEICDLFVHYYKSSGHESKRPIGSDSHRVEGQVMRELLQLCQHR